MNTTGEAFAGVAYGGAAAERGDGAGGPRG